MSLSPFFEFGQVSIFLTKPKRPGLSSGRLISSLRSWAFFEKQSPRKGNAPVSHALMDKQMFSTHRGQTELLFLHLCLVYSLLFVRASAGDHFFLKAFPVLFFG
jgi:hypothetical protein